MKRSNEINELAGALAKAQAEMKAAKMSRTNPHFKSKYAPLPDVVEVAKALNKHGLAYVQPVSTSGESGEKVHIETMLLHSSGQWMSEILTLRAQQATPQGVGSAITYGRRFGLCSIAGIVADEDDDGEESSKSEQRRPAATPANGRAHEAEPHEAAKEDPSVKLCLGIKERIVKCSSVSDMVKLDTEVAELHKARSVNDAQKKWLAEIVAARLKDLRLLQEQAA